MKRYRKKPVVIEAVQWHQPGDHPEVLKSWKDADTGAIHGPSIDAGNPAQSVVYAIKTLEGWHEVTPGDYIIRGVQGELYPCKPDIFAATYDRADGMSEADHLRFLIQRLHDKLHYGDVFQWDDGDPVWNEMRRAAGEPEED